mmetsp:Transcript_6403/g.10025  ORF Transcript_6403/g.10025 Transcript_6403/m.10025 type:complete len:157 (+) Transcript_6403:83-553(+)
MKIRYAAVMAKHILIHVWLPHRGRVYSITANVGQAGISVEETVSVKVVSTATFQTEIVVTLLGENASPSLLGKTVMALQITKFAAVTTNSTRITAKPISRAGRVFKIQAAAPMNLLLSKSQVRASSAAAWSVSGNEKIASYCPSKFQLDYGRSSVR